MNPKLRWLLLLIGGVLIIPLIACKLHPDAVSGQSQFGAENTRDKVMRVSIEQSGGFTGIPFTSTVDTESLSAEEAGQLRQLVDDADFFNLPRKISGAIHPDQFEYRVTVEESGQKHEVTVMESTLPNRLRPLLTWVREAASRR